MRLVLSKTGNKCDHAKNCEAGEDYCFTTEAIPQIPADGRTEPVRPKEYGSKHGQSYVGQAHLLMEYGKDGKECHPVHVVQAGNDPNEPDDEPLFISPHCYSPTLGLA